MIRAHKPFLWHGVLESGLQPASEARVKALLMEEGGAQVGKEKKWQTGQLQLTEDKNKQGVFQGEAGGRYKQKQTF